MKIVHVSDCYLPKVGGIETMVDGLATRQRAAGHDVEIITSAGSGPDDGMDAPVRVHRPAAHGAAGRIRYATTWRGAALVRHGRFDLVHAHLSTWSPLAFLAVRTACRAGTPVAVTVHSMWGSAAPVLRAAASTGWRHWPAAWSAVSPAAARAVVGVLAGTPVAVVPNAVASERWMLPDTGRDPSRVVIASVMRLAARKRPGRLLSMLARLRQQIPDRIRLQAVIIGDGPQRSRLRNDVRRLGIAEWVQLSGALPADAIREQYRDCDIYIAPATLESFGLAALEARAAGLPVLAYTGTGVTGFVTHGVNGLLADDDAGMLAALAQLVTDHRLRAAITAHNRARQPAFGWERVLAAYEALYARARVLSRWHAPSAMPTGAVR